MGFDVYGSPPKIIFDFNNRYGTGPYGGIQLYQNGSTIHACVASTSSQYLGGSCLGFTAPSVGASRSPSNA